MNLLTLIKKRRSIRAFQPKPIPAHMFDMLVDAARWAPSAGNKQPLEIIIVTDNSIKHKLAIAALNQEHVKNAPAVLVMCGDVERTSSRYGERGKSLYVIQDIAAATQNLLLMATALGLGSVWVGAFHEEQVKQVLNLPEHIRPMALIPIGYPNETPNPPQRREIQEITHYNIYGNHTS